MKTVIITGASKGIGYHLVEHFILQGFTVIGCARGASRIISDRYFHFKVDITVEQEVLDFFYLMRQFGQIDVLINNVGMASMNHSLLMPYKTAKKIMETNVLGTFLMSREAAKLMLPNKKGHIINFASFAVPLKLEGEAIYAASKAGIISLTEIMAKEFADSGIFVNAISPPAIHTNMTKGVPEQKMQAILNRNSIHRFGVCQDVARTIDFLINFKNDMINGQVIYMGGV